METRIGIVLTLFLAVLSYGYSQPAGKNAQRVTDTVYLPPPPRPHMNDERRAKLEKYDPVISLIAYITSLNKGIMEKKITINKSRAPALTEFLTTLSDKENESPEEAKDDLTRLQSILTRDEEDIVKQIWNDRDNARRKSGKPQSMKLPDGSIAIFDEGESHHDTTHIHRVDSPQGLDGAIEGNIQYNPFGPDDPIAGKAVENIKSYLDTLSPSLGREKG